MPLSTGAQPRFPYLPPTSGARPPDPLSFVGTADGGVRDGHPATSCASGAQSVFLFDAAIAHLVGGTLERVQL